MKTENIYSIFKLNKHQQKQIYTAIIAQTRRKEKMMKRRNENGATAENITMMLTDFSISEKHYTLINDIGYFLSKRKSLNISM